MIKVDCENCKMSARLPIEHYITKMKKKKLNDSLYVCKNHGGAPNESYCENCNIHLCNKCDKEPHKEHTVINLEGLASKADVDEIKQKLKQARQLCSRYLPQIYKKMQSFLKREDENLKQAFKNCMKDNEEVLFIIQQILNNYEYNKHNYFVVRNLTRIGQIDLTKCRNPMNLHSVGNYLDWYCVGTVRDMDFTRFMKQKRLYIHNGRIYSLIRLTNGKLASSSSDKTIKIYDPVTDKCELTIKGHTSDVTTIAQLSENQLISGSSDKKIILWKINGATYECEHTYEGHKARIQKVISLTKNRIGSCSRDRTIKIWSSKEPYNLLATLVGHMRGVNSILQIKGTEKLISGSSDHSFMVWSLSTYTLDTIITEGGCKNPNSMIEISGNRLASAIGPILIVLNLSNYEILCWKRNPPDMHIYSMLEIEKDHLLFGCLFGELGLYNIKTNKLKHSYDHYRREAIWKQTIFLSEMWYKISDKKKIQREAKKLRKKRERRIEYTLSMDEYMERSVDDLYMFFDDSVPKFLAKVNKNMDEDEADWQNFGKKTYNTIPLEDFSLEISEEEEEEKASRSEEYDQRIRVGQEKEERHEYSDWSFTSGLQSNDEEEEDEEEDKSKGKEENKEKEEHKKKEDKDLEKKDNDKEEEKEEEENQKEEEEEKEKKEQGEENEEEEEEDDDETLSDLECEHYIGHLPNTYEDYNFHCENRNSQTIEEKESEDRCVENFYEFKRDEFDYPDANVKSYYKKPKEEIARTVSCLLPYEKNSFITGYIYKKINVWKY